MGFANSRQPLWLQRLLGSTRGRLLALLRREPRTVDDLALQLDLTDNAIRAHLTAMERDGLVEQRGVMRSAGRGKPAYSYGLTPEATQLFPRQYADVLGAVINALDRHMTPTDKQALLRKTGRRMAEDVERGADANQYARLEAAAAALTQLGGLAGVEEVDGTLMICGYDCPLAAVVEDHPEICQLAEAYASEVAGLPLRERCDRESAAPQCRFSPAD